MWSLQTQLAPALVHGLVVQHDMRFAVVGTALFRVLLYLFSAYQPGVHVVLAVMLHLGGLLALHFRAGSKQQRWNV